MDRILETVPSFVILLGSLVFFLYYLNYWAKMFLVLRYIGK